MYNYPKKKILKENKIKCSKNEKNNNSNHYNI